MTHELRNVLAVIRETGGLVQDILAMDPQMATHPRADRIQQGFQTLRDQVLRGSEIIERLNRFAHTADFPEQHFDLGSAALEFFQLSDRFCKLRQITLLPPEASQELPVCASRFYFFASLFKALEFCLSLPEGSRIPVSFSREKGVCFHLPDAFPLSPPSPPEGCGTFRIQTGPGEICVGLDGNPNIS